MRRDVVHVAECSAARDPASQGNAAPAALVEHVAWDGYHVVMVLNVEIGDVVPNARHDVDEV